MTTFMRKVFVLCAAVALLAALPPHHARAAEDDGTGVKMTLAGGPLGGGASMALAAFMKAFLAQYPNAKVDLMPGNGTANPARVSAGQVNVAHAQGALLKAASEGKAPYKKKHDNLRSLFSLNDDCRLLLFAREDAPIQSLEDLAKNHPAIRLSPATRGSTNDMFTRWALGAYGVDYPDIEKWGGTVTYINFDAMVDAMKDKQLDMVGYNGPGFPAFLRQILLSNPVRFLPVGEAEMEKLKERGLKASVIKAGEFEGLPAQDVPVATDTTEIICSADMPDELAYKIAKIWTENARNIALANPGYGTFDPAVSCKNTALPLHPGAERYFREAGYLK